MRWRQFGGTGVLVLLSARRVLRLKTQSFKFARTAMKPTMKLSNRMNIVRSKLFSPLLLYSAYEFV